MIEERNVGDCDGHMHERDLEQDPDILEFEWIEQGDSIHIKINSG
jgi:hypothetical protein